MNCYVYEQKPGPGGTHYHVKAAVEPGSPLLCPGCAELLHGEVGKKAPMQAELHQLGAR